MEIKNNTFLVAGGASGLGLASAQMIVENGGNVVILDINEETGKSIESDKVLFVKTDVSNEMQVQNAIDLAINTFGGLQGVCNCAGIGPAQRVIGKSIPHSLNFFSKIIEINLIGTFNVIRLAANIMQNNQPNKDGERGIIINTASIAAFDGQIGQAAYSASKGGIVAMTLPIARELARFGIRVMTIAPGIFKTPLLASLSQEIQDSLSLQVPFPSRFGQPSEFGLLVKHIFENQMLNGETIRLDGAIRMNLK
ncbi:3-hydroxyacyl-CoA dehydrogenase [Arcicella sp. LKC2W]|uniref:3-hydroxyacyl-CoA dehydrogenase n=1 Tax=Arcicella sp. LKC2W TaxID=2984198 RepID=UPI002B1F86AF|nr:3-hydroxyacyl-CoA dehydrogenase [Arcicella sp. LKC2W]MEA5461098.1 3-hydroxyacyl-CoA dehydrogenase [Arcicella sp. LKC2W]